jgi:hypothetical protein
MGWRGFELRFQVQGTYPPRPWKPHGRARLGGRNGLRAGQVWRWLLARNDSPRYPSVRLFWLTSPGARSHPLNAVANALQGWVSP